MENKKPLVINLFGGPCTGKSATGARIFAALKEKHINVELVTEYAKDLTWEGRFDVLSEQQLVVFANQYARLRKVAKHVDVIITDSPLLMCIAYTPVGYYSSFIPLVTEAYNSFNNVQIELERVTEYQPHGRSQDEQQAKQLDTIISDILNTYGRGEYTTLACDDFGPIIDLINFQIDQLN